MGRKNILGILVSVLLMFFYAASAYAGATYEYYPSGRIKSVTYSPPENGVTYVEYFDEDWQGHGRGRVYRTKKASSDSWGAIAFEYRYCANGVTVENCYSDDSFTQLLCGAIYGVNGDLAYRDFENSHGENYEYYSSGRVRRITYDPAQNDGILYREYLDEDYEGQKRGRVFRQMNVSPDADGAMSFEYICPATEMILGDFNGDTKTDIMVKYSDELYVVVNGDWETLSSTLPGSMHQTVIDKLLYDYRRGFYAIVGGEWTGVASTVSNKTTTAYAYGNSNFRDLVYTATYDGDGELLKKEYPEDIIIRTETGKIEVKRVADEDGAKAYRYEYYSGTDIVKARYAYSYADLSDGSDPKLVGYLYTDHFDATGAFTERTREINLYSLQNMDRWFPIRAADTAAVRE
ncbi:MAG: hypothetical protein GF392_00890, partial [Candidatus Omnitrophica bacterium]|nr:hypothetical protein [Candidatus Omnitrophota bacterium]